MSVGIHILKKTHISDEINHKSYYIAIAKETELLNMSAISLFLIGPKNKKKITLDINSIKSYCQKNNIEIWPHASYISTGIWSVDHSNRHENKSIMYINHIKDHLVIGKQLGAKGITFHLPRKPIETIVSTMEVLSNCKIINGIRSNKGTLPLLILEQPASRPDDVLTYETPEKLNALVKALVENPKITLPWGLNPDTCHSYAGGINFSNPGSWNEWESKLTPMTRSKIKLIHLNDAEGKNYGTGQDGHIIPMAHNGAIWGHLVSDEFREYLKRTSVNDINKLNLYDQLSDSEKKVIKDSSLNEIVQFCKRHDVAMIMEINRGDYKDVKFAMDVVNHLLGTGIVVTSGNFLTITSGPPIFKNYM